MNREWRDEDLKKMLKGLAGNEPSLPLYDHAWFKIEDKIANRRRPIFHSLVWKPWGHLIRWVGAAACLFVVFSGLMVHEQTVDNNELGAYLVNVANTPESVTNDPGFVKVSVLLSEPSSTAPNMTVDSHADPLSEDEIFL